MKRTALLFQLLASLLLALAGCGNGKSYDGPDASVGAISQANMVFPACGPQNQCPCGLSCNSANHRCEGFTSNCHNGIKDCFESDVDCGATCGSTTLLCALGKTCGSDDDCASTSCENGICVDPCTNGKLDTCEDDFNCGGTCPTACPVCADGKGCKKHSSCRSGFCDIGLPTVTLPGRTTPQNVCNSNPCTIGTPSTYWMSDIVHRCGDGYDSTTQMTRKPPPESGNGLNGCPRCPTSVLALGYDANYPMPLFHPAYSTVYECNAGTDCQSTYCDDQLGPYIEPWLPKKFCMPPQAHINDGLCKPQTGENFTNCTDCRPCNMNNVCDVGWGETSFNCADCWYQKSPDLGVPDMSVRPPDMTVPPDMTKLPDMTVRPPDMAVPPDLYGVDMMTPYTCHNGICEVAAGENNVNCCDDCACNPGMMCQNHTVCVMAPDGPCRKNARCRMACMGQSRCDNSRNVCTQANPVNAQEEVAAYNLAYCILDKFTHNLNNIPQCTVGGSVQSQANLCNAMVGVTLSEQAAFDQAIVDPLIWCDPEIAACR